MYNWLRNRIRSSKDNTANNQTAQERQPDTPTPPEREVPNEQIPLVETDTLDDGTSIGRNGATWYVLDPEGRAVSARYHDIKSMGGGKYVGKLGTREETFTVDNPGTGTHKVTEVSAQRMPYRVALEQADELLSEAQSGSGQYDDEQVAEAHELITDVLEKGYH